MKSKKINKKSQMKIQQMAFMLIAITIFFILAGIFALTLRYSDIQKSGGLIQEENAMLLASKLANSPEFSCGKAFGGDKIDCVDADKVMILTQNSEKYKNFWGVENIEIIKIPLEYGGNVCSRGNHSNYPNCDRIRIFDKEIKGVDSSTFVSLCRKEAFEGESYNQCDVAKLMISYKTK
ncbi:MAG: hypothetical protein ABIH28_01080 [archaeon]